MKVKYTRYRLTWPRRAQEVKAPLLTGRLYPPGIYWYSFLEAGSTPGTWTCRMLRKKKSPVTRPGIDPGTLTTTLPQEHAVNDIVDKFMSNM